MKGDSMNENRVEIGSDMAALDSGINTRVGLTEVVGGVLDLVWRFARSWWQWQ